MRDVQRVRVRVDLENAMGDCRALVRRVFPDWGDDVRLEVCSGGITNSLVRATRGAENVLVRIYGRGTEVIVDREAEMANALRLHERGLGPRVYARFDNGFVYGFVPGDTLDLGSVREPVVCAAIARRLAQLHALSAYDGIEPETDALLPGVAAHGEWSHARDCPRRHGPHLGGFLIFRSVARWLAALPERYERPDVDAQFRERVSLAAVRDTMAALEEALCGRRCAGMDAAVFCHNDLLPGNIVRAPGGSTVDFIDYEYGGPNFRGFDVGNHFCEWAGGECDYRRFPDADEQARWIHRYVLAVREETAVVLDEERLGREAALGALLAHLYWGAWALLQAHISAIDFDYMAFAVGRLDRLLATKDAALADWYAYVRVQP